MQSSPTLLLIVIVNLLLGVASVDETFDYPMANLSTVWTNSPSLPLQGTYMDGSVARALLLRLNPYRSGPSFAFGFFCNGIVVAIYGNIPYGQVPCTKFFLAVAIVYCNSGAIMTSWGNDGGVPKIIWSANDGKPVGDNATLHFSSDGDLVLRGEDGAVLWSSGTAGRSVAGMNMTSSGNLVLYDGNNATVWQSFDHPIDALLPGQLLNYGARLIPNVSSATNWTTSRLYLTVLSKGLAAFVNTDPPQQYYQGYGAVMNQSGYIIYSNGSLSAVRNSGDEPVNLMTLPYLRSQQVSQYIRFETDGHLRLYEYGEIGWAVSRELLDTKTCDYPTVCGQYGICSNQQQCSCPPGNYFWPLNERVLNLGCPRVTPVSCQSEGNQMLSLEDTNYFDRRMESYIDSSEEDCKQTCLKNCSCMMAVFNYGGNRSTGQCYFRSEVFSLQTQTQSGYNCSVHLKVHQDSAGLPAGDMRRSSNQKLGIALGVVIGVASVVVAVFIILRNKSA